MSGHCCLEEFSQSSKISVLFMSEIKSCDSLLNLLIFSVCPTSWMNDSLSLWFSNFSINLLTFVLAFCILLLDCRKTYSKYSVIHGVVTDFTVTFRTACRALSWACFNLHQNTLFWKRFQVFLCGAILGFVRSHGVSPMPYTSSIGFTLMKKTACLPLLRLVPPGTDPFLIVEFNSFAFQTW